MNNSYRYFKNVDCKYFPCHEIKGKDFNCLFCFCPLYLMGDLCGGDFEYIKNVKSCSNCILPHKPEYYDEIISKIKNFSGNA